MMQDFLLARTPAMARRLRELAQVTGIDLSDDILALAEEGLVSQEFQRLPALSKVERNATQRVLDYGFRGMLLADSVVSGRRTALAALALTPRAPTVIATPAPKVWAEQCAEYGLTASQSLDDTSDCLIVSHDAVLSQAVLSERRAGILILDQQDRTGSHAGEHDYRAGSKAAREVERTLFIQNYGDMLSGFHGWSHICDIRLQMSLEELWPERALRILNQTHTTVSGLKSRNFQRFRACHLYFMFNVIADLLGDRQAK